MQPLSALHRTRRTSPAVVVALCLLIVGVLGVARAQANSSASVSVTITSSPATGTANTVATISFTATGTKRTDCRLDGSAFATCSSPATYTGLAVGTHTFVVRATGQSGRSAKATVSWDVVAPAARFSVTSSITSGWTLAGSLAWTATPSPSASAVDFYIDGALRWTEGFAPYVFNGDGNKLDTTTLANGSHVLKVVATANDGTKSEASATVQVANGSSPSFTVTSSIADTSTLSGRVTWQATTSRSVVGVDFYVDGARQWNEAFAPYQFNGDPGGRLDTTTLSDGTHTLKVVATASDGSSAEASATVRVANGAAPSSSPPPPPTTTPPPPPTPEGAASAGRVQFMEKTSPSTDPYTNNPTVDQQQWFRDHWKRAVVYSSYWDSKNSWYPQAWAYIDAYAIYNPSTLANQHPDWILKDAAGNKLYIPWGCSGGTCPQYAADIGSSAWRQYFIDICKSLIAKGYKGIHVDDVDMDINVGNGAGQSVAPIDPRTGQPMTDTQWKAYFADFLEQLRAALPGVEIAHNAIWFTGGGNHDGTNPYIQRQIRAADVINLERGFNDGGLTGGTGSWSVSAFMRYIDNVHSYGAHVVIQSYATDTTSAEYNLAGYFLINDGNDYVSTTAPTLPGQWWTGYDTYLGDATSGRYLWNGVWRRDFTGGVVLLNEPGATAKTLTLGGTFKTAAGQTVSTVTLGASRGAVLTAG